MQSGAKTCFHSQLSVDPNSELPHRYHLFSAKTCPFAHRTEIVRLLKGLETTIGLTEADSVWTYTNGWLLDNCYKAEGIPNPVPNVKSVVELYKLSAADYSGRSSLPVLFDLQTNQIVNNESSQIIEIFNGRTGPDLYPLAYRGDIDKWCSDFGTRFSTAHYKAGHAKSQQEYEVNYDLVFSFLDDLELHMSDRTYVCADQLTLADVHIYAHLIRFDPIFYSLFHLNRQHLWEYRAISDYMRRLSSISAFKDSTDIKEMQRGYFLSETNIPANLGVIKIPKGDGGVSKLFPNQ